MKIKDLKNKKITVMGLGLNEGGVGVSEFLAKVGAKVLVTDLKSAKDLRASLRRLKNLPLKYVLGKHREEDFIETEMVIKNPAVSFSSPYLRIAQKHKIPIETDIGLFFKLLPKNQEIVAITGTKGKSTTTNLIYQLLKRAKKNVVLAGNMGISVFKVFPRINKETIVVLEISAQQLEGLKKDRFHPHLAVVTNLLDDHLDRYGDMNFYAEVKKIIFKYQNKKEFIILNYDNLYTRKMAQEAKGRIYWFSKFPLPLSFNGVFLRDKKIIFQEKRCCKEIMPITEIPLLGEHNINNVLAAVGVGMIYQLSPEIIRKVIKKFKGVPFRLELIREKNGISFYNDTTATTPFSALCALKSFTKPIVLITGGKNKKMDFTAFGRFVSRSPLIKKIILLTHPAYNASLEIQKIMEKERKGRKIIPAGSIKEAVTKAVKVAKKGEIVLLSPAAASFGMFQNEFDRGRQFNKEVKSL